jgi:hypothetical protein
METLEMHTYRIQSIMPIDTPKFQLQLAPLWGKSGDCARVVIIKVDEKNKDELIRLFETLHKQKQLSFFAWTDFMSCTPDQKSALVKRLNYWHANYHSLLITGFKDNDDNIPMKFDKTDIDEDPLNSIGVTEFLNKMVKNSIGDQLFHHVYPPYKGTREVLVTLNNYSQATSYIMVSHIELAQNMDRASIEKIFIDTSTIYGQAHMAPWVPNDRITSIIPQSGQQFN